MTVTQFSKSFGQPSWARWDSEFPAQTYRFRDRGRFFGDAMRSGERFHCAFSQYTAGLWVPPVYYEACLSVEGALAGEKVAEIQSEVPVQGFGLAGQVDVAGTLESGRPVVAELKTTLGEYALKPKPAEVIQLGTYATMFRHEDPLLLWLRVSLKSRCISLFKMDQSEPLLTKISGCLSCDRSAA